MKTARLLVALLVAISLAACGTRLPDEAFATDTQVNTGSGDQDGGDGTVTGDGGLSTDGSATGTDEGAAATDGSATDGGATTGGDGSTTGGSSGTAGGTEGSSGPNQASDVGVTPNQIVIGSIVAENGVLGDAFAPSARGMRAWAAWTNAHGGIHGREVVLKTCDDGEVRSKALECARRLVEQEKAFAIVGANTRAMGGAAEYLNSAGIPVFGTPITNSYYRYPHFWPIYPFGYPRDGKTVGWKGDIVALSGIYRWFKTHLNVTKAAVFAYDIDESKQAGESFAKGLQLEGFKVDFYTVSFAAPSFDQAVADMQRNGTQILFDTMDDGANRKLCDAMQRRTFKPKAKVSTIVSMGQKVGTAYNSTCKNILFIPGESQPYTATNVPMIADFRAAFAKYQPGKELHQWALEAFGQGELVREALEKMGPTPTRKGLEAYFRNLDRYSGNGLWVGLDWRPQNYDADRNEDCFSISRWLDSKGGWTRATEKFPFCYPDAFQYRAPALEQGN